MLTPLLQVYMAWTHEELIKFSMAFDQQVLQATTNTFMTVSKCFRIVFDQCRQVCVGLWAWNTHPLGLTHFSSCEPGAWTWSLSCGSCLATAFCRPLKV